MAKPSKFFILYLLLSIYNAEGVRTDGNSTTLSAKFRNVGPTTTVNLEGVYTWELLFDIDNLNNSGSISRKETYKYSRSLSYSRFHKSVEEIAAQYHVGIEIGGFFNILSIGVQGSLDQSTKTSIENLVENKTETFEEYSKEQEITIGPNSRFKLYRLVFTSPGVSVVTETLATSEIDMGKVHIAATVRSIDILKMVDVVYTDQAVDQPRNSLSEKYGSTPDINYQFGGDYVWLVPIWTNKKDDGVTSIQLVIQGNENKNYEDLARGAGGKFRYLKMMFDPSKTVRVGGLGLVRRNDGITSPTDHGWDRCTHDINQGRGGTYLYLCWEQLKEN